MFIVGAFSTLFSSFLYSVRASILHDFSLMPINKSSVTFFYRLFSLPIIIAIFYLSGQTLPSTSRSFLLWFGLSIGTNFTMSFVQLKLYDKHQLSTVESQKFLGVLFASIIGYYAFAEVLAYKELLGLIVLVVSFIGLYLYESQHKIHFDIALYYLFLVLVDIVNRQTIRNSTPMAFSLYITIAMVFSNLMVATFTQKDVYNLSHFGINWRLAVAGVVSALAIIGTSYGYKYLPIGLVSSILSTQTFFSLGLCHYKHKEKNLLPKIFASSFAFLGILTIFLH